MTIKIRRASGETKFPCEGSFKLGDNWAISLNTLDELFLLAKKEQSLIVYADEIVIYDDYVE